MLTLVAWTQVLMVPDERRYLLGPLERRGLVAGWRTGQVLVVACSAALAGVTVALSTAPPVVIVAVAFVAAGVFAATVPVRGRTVDEWVPSFVAHLRHRGSRVLVDVEVVDASDLGGRDGVGVVRHRSGSLSVTVALDSTGIALLEPDARNRRVDGFISALGALSREGCVIDRVGWVAWSGKDAASSLVRDVRRRGAGGVPAAISSYRSLLGSAAASGLSRRVELTLRTSPAAWRIGRTTEPVRALLDEADLVARALEDAGHRRCRFLDRDEIAERICGVAPPSEHTARRVTLRGDARFDAVTIDGRSYVTWWVAEWPRAETTAELLAPLLLGGERHLMAVVVEPVAPSAALRRAASARTSEVADAEIRRRGGFLADRRHERQRTHTATREAELVDGHGSLRISGYLAVGADESAALGQKSAETELAAAQARLVLRRLQGDHGRGYVAMLPLAAGLP